MTTKDFSDKWFVDNDDFVLYPGSMKAIESDLNTLINDEIERRMPTRQQILDLKPPEYFYAKGFIECYDLIKAKLLNPKQ